MACVLLGWELGAGFGHVGHLLPIAQGLAAHGHRPVFVVKDLQGPRPMLKAHGFPVLQAPLWPMRPQQGDQTFRAATLGDILAVRGFAVADELEAQVEAWQQLLDLTDAKLVVSDYSPTLNLAAYRRVPIVLVGNNLGLPPPELMWFPTLDANAVPVLPQERVLANIQEVQRRRGRAIPERLPELFSGDGVFFCSFPEMDPYPAVRQHSSAVGPMQTTAKPEPLPVEPLAFVYLSAKLPGAEQVLPALAAVGIRGVAYFREGSADQPPRLQAPGFDVSTTPLPLEQVLAGVRVVVHQAGSGTAATALAIGRPQVCMSNHLDQGKTADSIQGLGVGLHLPGQVSLATFTSAVKQVMTEPRFGIRAQEIALDLKRRGPWPGLAAILDRCLTLLDGGSNHRGTEDTERNQIGKKDER